MADDDDFSNSVSAIGAMWPVNAISDVYGRLEYIVDAKRLKALYLAGIPLYSGIKDPITKRPTMLSDETLQELILNAISSVELETALTILPTRFKERAPLDPQEWKSFSYFRVKHRPVSSVEALDIRSSDDIRIFNMPKEWIEPGLFQRGQINVVPYSPAFQNSAYPITTGDSAPGSTWNLMISRCGWVPNYFTVLYTAGFPDGKVPSIVNQLIGITAAIDVLSMLAATFGRSTSHSLGIDALSQSVSGPGNMMFKPRIDDLMIRKEKLVNKLKAEYGTSLFSDNV